MTYLVLARKWRPRSFETLVGQEHVVRALTHALSTQRLHHAWLFTGTRGVGKTTLSRLLAKSLNCEQGITATPCGVCRACTEIDEGRFVDYVELDAASNRGVDEMTQLLEQAVYAPGAGRFKVYMIDEVHMLTGHAFNAMLKTLEEPPAHVKFILATTDPQKIPVTVLSRCLQFNLKQMTAPAIVSYLQNVLEHEHMTFEVPALRLIAQAASGSMRDALSLTDQAIAYSAGDLSTEAIQTMLGTLDQRYLTRLLLALAAGEASDVLAVADELAARGLSYTRALADLAVLLSRVAIAQRIEGSLPDDDPLTPDLTDLARQLHPDLVQLFYTVAVHSRHELSLAPDEYAGFVMACLRMLALAPDAPDTATDQPRSTLSRQLSASPDVAAALAPTPESPAQNPDIRVSIGVTQAAPSVPASPPATVASAAPAAHGPLAPRPGPKPEQTKTQAHAATDFNGTPAWEDEPERTQAQASGGFEDAPVWEDESEQAQDTAPADFDGVPAWEIEPGVDYPKENDDPQAYATPADPLDELEDALIDSAELSAAAQAAMPALMQPGKKPRSPRLSKMTAQAWPELAAGLPLTGLAAELARQSEWVSVQADQITLRVAVRTLAESPGKARLCTVLSEHFGEVVTLKVDYGVTGDETAHAVEQAQRAERQKQAEIAVQDDPFVQTLINEFGARLVPDSVRAVSPSQSA